MDEYDPLQAPDSKEWLAMDESERLVLVEDYHINAGVDLPNRTLHCTIHTMVENQLAGGEVPEAERALERLLAEGLDRHEAIHAIGSVLTKHVYNIIQKDQRGDPNEAYDRELKLLTAERWRSI